MSRHRRTAAVLICALGAIACDDESDPGGVPNLTAPAVTVVANGNTGADVTWSAVAGAAGYTVERAEGGTGGSFAQIATPSGTSYADHNLTAGSSYRYRVAATRSGTTGPFSAEATVTLPGGGPAAATIADDITADRTLFSDTVYTLQGFIRVANGATLTIEAGTQILGDFETLGSSLFVLRGARIRAMGTADQPIVFTSSRPVGQRQPGDWGGLILIGNGEINRTHPIVLEGTENFPQPLTYSGGTDNTDSSGELHYVRVEFAGYATAPNAELNSFTFAAVGSGTQMDHLQALAGLDDHYEWFGGAADAKYLVSYEAGDDHFDMSEGFRGRLQHLIAYQSKVLQPRPGAGNVSSDPQGIENDGCGGGESCPQGELSQPYNMPMVANFTLIGTGPDVISNSGGIGMLLRRGTGGVYVNGVIARWPLAAISLRNEESTGARLDAGELAIRNVLLADNGAAQQSGDGRFQIDAAANGIAEIQGAAASLFQALPATPAGAADFDWTPSAGSVAATGGMDTFAGAIAAKAGTFVQATSYRGAAPAAGGTNANWWAGWTEYASN